MTDENIPQIIVNLIDAIAWPIIVLVLLYLFRKELRKILGILSERIEDSDFVKVTKEGIEIKNNIEAIEAKASSQQALNENITKLFENIQDGKKLVPNQKEAMIELEKIAGKYTNFDHPEWRVKVDTKNDLVRKMIATIILGELDRQVLAQTDNEGIRAGLAGTIHFDPQANDIHLLVQLIKRTRKKHVSYKIVLGLIRLTESHYLTYEELPLAKFILNTANSLADKPLKKLISQAEALLKRNYPDIE